MSEMSKKVREKPKRSDKTKANREVEKNQPVDREEDKPFDFGGLPNRDLKKNLGCR